MSQSDEDDYWNGRAGLPTRGAYGEIARREVEEERSAREAALRRATARPEPPAPKPAPRQAAPAPAADHDDSGGTLAGLITLAAALGAGALVYNATQAGWPAIAAAVVAGFVASKIWKLIVVVAIVAVLALVFGSSQ